MLCGKSQYLLEIPTREKEMSMPKIKAVFACLLIFLIVLSEAGCAIVSKDEPKPKKPVITDRLRTLPAGSVRLSGFMQERLQQQSEYLFDEKTLAEMVDAIRKRPHRIVDGKPTCLAEGEFWGKAVRALCRYYQYSGDERLRKLLDMTVADLMSLQETDGCISDTVPELQPYHSDMWDRKYTLLGLVNTYESTGDPRVLRSAIKMADHTLSQVGPSPKVRIVDTSFNSSPTNPTGWFYGIESSSILEPFMRLYHLTGKKEYFEFARYIVEDEGCTSTGNLFEEMLAGKDARDLVLGKACHAYSITSCFEGLMEYYRATGNENCKNAAMKLYENIQAKELAVIGTYCGLGPGGNENFCHTALYQTCPKVQGLEACSAPRWMAFCRHLLGITGDSKFADDYELSLYNAVLGSIRPDGKAVDYFTHLTGTRPDLKRNFRREFNGKSFTCCSYNVGETLACVPFTAVMSGDDGPVLNLYIPGRANVKLADGNEVAIKLSTDYPKTGEVTIDVSPLKPARFPIRLRIPQWSKQTSVTVNGIEQEAKPGRYLVLDQDWKAGDRILLSLDMRCRLVRSPEGSPKSADGFRVLVRGPLVLARDKRLGGNIHEEVDIQADGQGYVAVTPITPTVPALVQFAVPISGGGSFPVIDFAASGNTWDERSERVTWIPRIAPPSARWIWFPDTGNSARNAPVGKRWFRRVVKIPEGRQIKQATVTMCADNEFTLFINGRKVGSGTSWQTPVKMDLTSGVKPGPMVLAVEAVNTEFTGPSNAAGLLGRVQVEFVTGPPMIQFTDGSWKTSDKEITGWQAPGFSDDAWKQVRVLGRIGMSPWGGLDEF